MAKTTYIARTQFGDFTRTSARIYTHCVARKDGWHQFSQSEVAAKKELAYQLRRGRDVVLVTTEVVGTRPQTSIEGNAHMQTITERQIRGLRNEAAEGGDTAQRIICDMALDGEDSRYDADYLDEDRRPDYSGGGHSPHELRAIRAALRMTQEDARAECARVIAEAKAQED